MSITEIRKPQSQITLTTVSPQKAAEWLANSNQRNRPMSPALVKRYAKTMSLGLWRHPTGECLIFDWDGMVQDGQHRLAAQVQSGVTIDYYIVTNADPSDFLAIGQGKARTVGQILHMDGVSNGNGIGAIARLLLQMLEHPDARWTGAQIPAQESLEFARNNQELLGEHYRMARAARDAGRLPLTSYAAVGAYAELISDSAEQWREFHELVVSGIGLDAESPILTLRRWAITRSTRSGIKPQEQVVFITKAWNGFVERRDVKLLKWLNSEIPMPLPLPCSY